jgi:hypothetical protein
MTQAEARQQFATSHLYWHGRHCWDAMTPSRHVVHGVRENVQREAQRDPVEPSNPEPKWREAMSEMLTVNEAPSPSVNWENRWVEIAQVSATLAGDKAAQEDISANATHRIEPMFTPMHVLLAFLLLVLMLLACALTPRWEGRRARRNLGFAKFVHQALWVMSPGFMRLG